MKCFNFGSDAPQPPPTVTKLGARQLKVAQTKHHQKLSLQHPASSSSEVVIVFEQKFPLTLWRQNSNTDQYISPSAKIKKCKKSTWKFYHHTSFLEILRQNGTPCIAQKPSLSSSLVEVLLVPPLAESLGQDLSPVCSEWMSLYLGSGLGLEHNKGNACMYACPHVVIYSMKRNIWVARCFWIC